MIPSVNRQKWLLLFGDVALIALATYLSPLIRLGQTIQIFDLHTGASVFTLILYIVMIYIFDLYNLNRYYSSKDSVFRAILAVGIAGFFASFLFYSFPSWKYGRGIFLVQMVLVYLIIYGWRLVFTRIYAVATVIENVLVLGAGKCSAAIYHLCRDSNVPFHIVGYLDDDPKKQNQIIGSPAVIGTTGRLMAIAAQKM